MNQNVILPKAIFFKTQNVEKSSIQILTRFKGFNSKINAL